MQETQGSDPPTTTGDTIVMDAPNLALFAEGMRSARALQRKLNRRRKLNSRAFTSRRDARPASRARATRSTLRPSAASNASSGADSSPGSSDPEPAPGALAERRASAELEKLGNIIPRALAHLGWVAP